jgi:hypothetical protein
MSFYFDPDDATGTAKRREAANALENQRREAERLRRPGVNPYRANQQQGVNPMQAYDIYSKFAGGGTGSGAMVGGSTAPTAGSMSGIGAASQSSAVSGSGLGGTAAGSGGASAAGAAGGGAAAFAGPAAIAAAIIANEIYQNKSGNRPNDFSEQVWDGFTGKSLERDLDRYIGGTDAGDATKRAVIMLTPSGAVRNAKDLWGWTKGLFD